MKPRVFITRIPPAPVLAALRERFDLTCPDSDVPMEPAAIVRAAEGCAGLVTMLNDRIDVEEFDGMPDLKVIANYAAGVNNINLEAARDRGLVVTNTPGVLTEATADLSFALLLAVARRIIEGDAFVRSGRWQGWGPTMLLGMELTGARLGIVGMGRIGSAVARRARGFGMEVLYHNRTRLPEDAEQKLGVRYSALDALLESADVISLHCPLTPETHHLIDADAFARMKHGALFINTGRGEVVDEAALIDALESGKLGGAGLDVFDGEPAVNPRLLEFPDVVLAPHVGSATGETRTRMGLMVADNLSAFFAGDEPPNRVV
ncbi:MAG: 2-hydroxyacid dehydrogenase [Leptospirillia bacterium]